MNREEPTLGARSAGFGLALIVLLSVALPGPARAEGERLVSLELCSDVQDREGVGCGLAFPADVGQVHAMLSVKVPPGARGAVTTVWRHGERVVQRQKLAIRFHRSGGYRTRSRQRIASRFRGPWSVEVQDESGNTLKRQDFSVGTAAPTARDAARPNTALGADEPAGDPAPAPTPEDDDGADDAGEPLVFTLDGGAGDEADDAGAGDDPQPDDAADAAAADPQPVDAAPSVEPAAAPAAATPAAPALAAPAPAEAPTAATPPTGAASDPAGSAAGDEASDRRRGGMLLLVGGLLLLVAGVIIARRRAGRARAASAPVGAPPAETPASATPPAGVAAVAAAAVPAGSDEAATDALQRLTDLVTHLWSRWVAATSGSPQRALNAAWRTMPDPGRLALDHIRLCNALESAAKDYSAIPPRGSSRDILRLRLYAQTPALIGVICALAVEAERLDLQGVCLDDAFAPWGGRAGLTAELLSIVDDGAAALGTSRLSLLPYETKATTASRDFDADLRPFPLPSVIADRLAAGNRIVRVETPPFDDGPRPVVWSVSPG